MLRKVATFNASKFLALARDARGDAAALVGSSPFIQTHREALRFALDESDYTDIKYVETPRSVEELRDELCVAAGKAYLNGATMAQIDFIVSLCVAKNDLAPMGYSRLTKQAASNLIEQLQR